MLVRGSHAAETPIGAVMSFIAARESRKLVPDTCPKIHKGWEIFEELIMEQTEALRDALIETLDRAYGAEERVEELEKEVQELTDRISELEALQ